MVVGGRPLERLPLLTIVPNDDQLYLLAIHHAAPAHRLPQLEYSSVLLPEIVDPVVAVPARAVEPDLHQPEPNLCGSRLNRDGPGGIERGMVHDIITRQRARNLVTAGVEQFQRHLTARGAAGQL